MDRAKTRLLITGASGLLGNNLAYYFKDKYEILGLYNSHPVIINGFRTEKCDITSKGSIKRIIQEFNPLVILHCASLTNVDQCELNKDIAKKINVLSTTYLIESVMDKDVKLVYISTDAVYDGVKGDFSENDKVNPLNYYGRTKYEGELEIAKIENSLIFRTNIFGWNIQEKKSLCEWILDELKANRSITGFKDAYFSSIYTLEFARIIDMAIQKDIHGVFNCGSGNSCSKYEFALKIADLFDYDKSLIKPISIEEFAFKARRGKNLSMNVNKIRNALNYKLSGIDHSLDAFYRDYMCGLPEKIKYFYSRTKEKSSELPYGTQLIDESDVKSVVDTLVSPLIAQGPRVEEFEKSLAEICNAEYAVAVNSGTSALHIACLAAGLKSGDEVITSPNTFVASANCAVYCGGKPVFADIDKMTYNISPSEIEKKITQNTKAIIPVHFAGQSCDMESISHIVKEAERKYGHKIFIIEDGCHALGSEYKSEKVGACVCSDMTVMSFHPVKHITTGEGGAVLTNDKLLNEKLAMFRSHGITKDPEKLINKDSYFASTSINNTPYRNQWWYYEQIDLGYNYRMTDVQAALGLSQLEKLDDFRKKRSDIVRRYNEAFNGLKNIQIPFESKDCNSNFHLYVLHIDFDQMGIKRSQFMIELKKKGIQTQVHYIPVNTQPYYQEKFRTGWGDCPNAEEYYQKCISIPLFPSMTNNDVERVVNSIKGN